MSGASRLAALLAYLFSVPAALLVLLARRDDAFARYHARQSLWIGILAIATPLVWAVCAWGLAWLPLFGAMLGVALFALVIAALLLLAVSSIMGMLYALRGRVKPVPIVGRWADRRPARATEPDLPLPAVVAAANELETTERRPTVDA